MPAGFEWCLIDVHDSAQIQEMYTLLTENYVEDDDCQFRYQSTVFVFVLVSLSSLVILLQI